MTQIEENKINATLYTEAQIYWQPNKDYSSLLLDRMLANGCKIQCIGRVQELKDKNGITIASGVGRVQLLMDLAKVMR